MSLSFSDGSLEFLASNFVDEVPWDLEAGTVRYVSTLVCLGGQAR